MVPGLLRVRRDTRYSAHSASMHGPVLGKFPGSLVMLCKPTPFDPTGYTCAKEDTPPWRLNKFIFLVPARPKAAAT